MKYFKIKAATYNEALMELRRQHGDEAIPISHKYIKEGGLMNSRFFAKEVVELTAALHEKRQINKLKSEAKSSFDVKVDNDVISGMLNKSASENRTTLRKNSDAAGGNQTLNDLINNINSMNSNLKKENDASRTKSDYIQETAAEQDKSMYEKEFAEIKETLKLLMAKEHEVREAKTDRTPEELSSYREILRKNDFDSEESDKMIHEVKNSLSKEDLKDKFKIEKTLKDLVKTKIITSGPIAVKASKKKIIMLVGPTGVGKTTSLAKLGAHFALREGKKVSFITIDTYRIAATEQLKKYAEIMKIPVHVVNEQKEFRTVIENEKSDIIFVDTSGRSHKNTMKIAEIKSYADQVDYDFEKILCISATTKKSDVIEVFKAFDSLDISSILITKTDETSFVGNVVDVADKYNKPISYIANGQEVPNDILIAERDALAGMIITETPF
ncbi:MAG: flagellar biosynthesis protein FlhF [Spirochaetes bacterium]|nr:flagellar biosynthesis protein FlhF [Spirochaetota bacterium]